VDRSRKGRQGRRKMELSDRKERFYKMCTIVELSWITY